MDNHHGSPDPLHNLDLLATDPTPMPQRRAREFVDELARDPQLVARILAVHVPDVDGRCAGCALDSSLREPYPCGPQVLAELAQQRIIQPPRRPVS